MSKKSYSKQRSGQGAVRQAAPQHAARQVVEFAENAFVLTPRHGLFMKDGREWGASASGHAHTLSWPFPSTVLGALRTAYGRMREAREGRALRPSEWAKLAEDIKLTRTVALRRPLWGALEWDQECRCWPAPADALFLGKASRPGEPRRGRILRLKPRRPDVPTLGRDWCDHDDHPPESEEAKAREALWRAIVDDPEKPHRPPAWWSEDAFVRWLADAPDDVDWGDAFAGFDLPRRVQAHVGIDPATLTHRPSILFAHDTLETIETGREHEGPPHEWALACEVDLKQGRNAPSGRLTLGGDRAAVGVGPARKTLFDCPQYLLASFSSDEARGLRLIAVTPLAFNKGWLPDGFEPHPNSGAIDFVGTLPPLGRTKLVLRAALLPRPTHVSGWDFLAATGRGAPKRTTRLAPPGAAFFLTKQDESAFDRRDAERLWLAAIGGRTNEGFGRVVPGVWDPKEQT